MMINVEQFVISL